MSCWVGDTSVGLPAVTKLPVGRAEAKRCILHLNSRLIPELGSSPTASVTWLQSSSLSQVDWCSSLDLAWAVISSAFPGSAWAVLSHASGCQAYGSFFIYSTSLSNKILSQLKRTYFSPLNNHVFFVLKGRAEHSKKLWLYVKCFQLSLLVCAQMANRGCLLENLQHNTSEAISSVRRNLS